MTMSNGMSEREEFLLSEVTAFEKLLAEANDRARQAQETIALLEGVIHKASKIAGHIPFLCRELSGADGIENAAMQLQRILIHREA